MSLAAPWIAAAATLFVWWFSTGAIIWGAKRREFAPADRQLRAVLWTSPILLLGGGLFWATLGGTALTDVYGAFLAAILIWGWIEFAFLTGVICGPNRFAMPANRPEWERFVRAWGVVAYHNLLLAAAMALIAWAAWGAANPFAFWTFAVLLFARISAQLNLFFGVAQVNVDFLPARLSHMASHFRTARMNAVFPLSVTGLTLAAACWVERAIHYEDAGRVAGFSILAAITILALLEHWMLMLKLPDDRLWRWLLPEGGRANLKITPRDKQAHDGL